MELPCWRSMDMASLRPKRAVQALLLEYIGDADTFRRYPKPHRRSVRNTAFVRVPEFSSAPFCTHPRCAPGDADQEAEPPNAITVFIDDLRDIRDTHRLIVLYGLRKMSARTVAVSLVGFTFCADPVFCMHSTKLMPGDWQNVGDVPETQCVARISIDFVTRRSLKDVLAALDHSRENPQAPPTAPKPELANASRRIALPTTDHSVLQQPCHVRKRVFLDRFRAHMAHMFGVDEPIFYTQTQSFWDIDPFCVVLLATACARTSALRRRFLSSQMQKYTGFFDNTHVPQEEKIDALRRAGLLDVYCDSFSDTRHGHDAFAYTLETIRARIKDLLRHVVRVLQIDAHGAMLAFRNRDVDVTFVYLMKLVEDVFGGCRPALPRK